MATKEKVKKGAGKSKVSAPAPAAAAAPAKDKKLQGGICLFSGEPTGSKTSHFLPGYDAKLKSLLIKVFRGEVSKKEIPSQALPFLRREKGLVGFRLEGDQLVHIGKFSVDKKEKSAKPKAAKKAKSAPVAEVEDEDDEDLDEDESDEEEYEEEEE